MKKLIFPLIIANLIALSCGGNALRITTAGQIISNSWEGEDNINEKNKWVSLRLPVILTKADSGDIIAMFIGEFKPVRYFDSDPETNKVVEVWGAPIELRIKINDEIASLTRSVITTTTAWIENYETRSFLASLKNLPPGTYTIMAEWRSAEKGAIVGNRTLTVWETVKAQASP